MSSTRSRADGRRLIQPVLTSRLGQQQASGLGQTALPTAFPKSRIMSSSAALFQTSTSSVRLRTWCAQAVRVIPCSLATHCMQRLNDLIKARPEPVRRSHLSSKIQHLGHTFEMCTPSRLWAPEQSTHIRMPRLMEAQVGFGAPQSAHVSLPGTCDIKLLCRQQTMCTHWQIGAASSRTCMTGTSMVMGTTRDSSPLRVWACPPGGAPPF